MTIISQSTKAKAKALLQRRKPIEHVADELGLPIPLIREWAKQFGFDDLAVIQSNTAALEDITHGQCLPIDNKTLEAELQNTALEIAKYASHPCEYGDVIQAKAINLCADSITKMYNTFILKNGQGNGENDANADIFQSLLKD